MKYAWPWTFNEIEWKLIRLWKSTKWTCQTLFINRMDPNNYENCFFFSTSMKWTNQEKNNPNEEKVALPFVPKYAKISFGFSSTLCTKILIEPFRYERIETRSYRSTLNSLLYQLMEQRKLLVHLYVRLSVGTHTKMQMLSTWPDWILWILKNWQKWNHIWFHHPPALKWFTLYSYFKYMKQCIKTRMN